MFLQSLPVDVLYNNSKLAFLSNILGKKHTHHSWLIYGNQGIGKATLVYKLIAQLLNNNFTDNNSYHPDLLIIDRASDKKDISIDAIRKINSFLSLTPLQSKFRIVLVDNCNYLNTSAANALLKILEEPPKNSLIFLISHIIGQLPSTIISRCVKIYMCNLKYNNSLQVLISLLPNIDEDSAKKLLTLSCGSIGLALALYHNNAIDNYQDFILLLNNINNLFVKQIWKWLDNIQDWKYCTILIHHFLAKLLKVASNINNLYYVSDDEQKLINFLCSKCEINMLIDLYDSIQYLLNECHIANLDQKQVVLTIFNNFRKIAL
ncbi:MAG: AAA family ATPase [Rickettsiales endosymbiont of Dermacentor nuttalli]